VLAALEPGLTVPVAGGLYTAVMTLHAETVAGA
jgi:hypothetical protein